MVIMAFTPLPYVIKKCSRMTGSQKSVSSSMIVQLGKSLMQGDKKTDNLD